MENKRETFWLGIGLLIVIALVAYIPVLQAEFVFDDRAYVVDNEILRSAEGLGKIWFELDSSPQYYPLVFTSYWLEYRLWGLNSFVYHLVNVLGHIFNGILLWLVLRRLGLGGAWFIAAIFLLHPIQVESLACVSERKNILSAAFYLLAILAYLRFCNSNVIPVEHLKKWWFYGLAMGLFVCALLSKTVTASLPVVFVLLLWYKHGRVSLKDLVRLIPFFVLAAIFGLLTLWIEAANFKVPDERLPQSFLEQILISGRALWFYVAKLLWPSNLCFIYPRWDIDVGSWWQYIYPAAAVGVFIAALLARRQLGRGPLVAIVFFVITLAPSLGFLNFGFLGLSFVADHFQYLACIGPIALIACPLTFLVVRYLSRYKYIGFIVAGVVLTTLGTLSWHRASIYHSQETLWRDTAEKNPEIWIAQYNLGTILTSKGNPEQAIRFYEEALRLNPDSSKVHCNLAVAFRQLGRIEEAVSHYNETLRLEPTHAKAHYNLGNILLMQGKFEQAIAHYQQALSNEPDYPKAHMNQGIALSELGRTDEAISCYQEAIRLQQDYADAYYNLGIALTRQNEIEQAIKAYREVLRIRPTDVQAREMLQAVLEQRGNKNE